MTTTGGASSAMPYTTSMRVSNNVHTTEELMSETYSQVTEQARRLLGAHFAQATVLLTKAESQLADALANLEDGHYAASFQKDHQAITSLRKQTGEMQSALKTLTEEHHRWRSQFVTAYTAYLSAETTMGQ